MVRLRVYCINTGQTASEYFLVYVFMCFINKCIFVWLILITAVWNNVLGVYAIYKPTDTTDIYFNQSLFIGEFSLPPFCLVSPASGGSVRATVRELKQPSGV